MKLESEAQSVKNRPRSQLRFCVFAATTQLEQKQLQIQQANISNALGALGISNSGVGQVAQLQYAQNTQAQSTLNQTGHLISQLNALGA
ncbi:hypothetical protein BSLA_01f2282 [Burkholderia stabilis]|nr:hypothetical protein BSLA_01f2282 [Burkholderia stabilis]